MSDAAYPDYRSTRIGRFTLRQLGVVQWIGVVVAPLAWTGQHVVGYGVGQARCEVGASWGIGFDTWQLAILAAAGLLVLLSEAGAVPPSRLHFFATAAMVANVLFLAIIFLDGLASVFDSLCVQS